jgi:hypothetical protein
MASQNDAAASGPLRREEARNLHSWYKTRIREFESEPRFCKTLSLSFPFTPALQMQLAAPAFFLHRRVPHETPKQLSSPVASPSRPSSRPSSRRSTVSDDSALASSLSTAASASSSSAPATRRAAKSQNASPRVGHQSFDVFAHQILQCVWRLGGFRHVLVVFFMSNQLPCTLSSLDVS